MNTLYWLIKREYWEHRGGFVWAPLITAGVMLVLMLMGIVTGEMFGFHHSQMHDFNFNMDGDSYNLRTLLESADTHQLNQVSGALDGMMLFPSLLICVVFSFVVFFYCLGALYDDRRDRSILFWRSLPISDTLTVISKVLAATIAAPIVAIVIGIVTGLLTLLIIATLLAFHGLNVWTALSLAHPLRMIVFLIATLPIYLLWALPSVGWLMLCSAWARSKPFLWAVVLPLVAGVFISWFNLLGVSHSSGKWYWTHLYSRALLSVVPGGWLSSENNLHRDWDGQNFLDGYGLSDAYAALGNPNIWIGAVIGLALLAAAIWLRRWREEG